MELNHPKPSELIANRVREASRPGYRNDDYKIAHILQGGSMRVALSAGAAMAEYQLFGDAMPFERFDGTSSGVPPWMYILAGSRHAEGVSIPYDELSRGFIGLRNLLRHRRIVNLDLMNDAFREGPKAFEFENILNHPTQSHIYARSVKDGLVVDFNIGKHALAQEQGAHLQNNEYVYFCHTAEDVLKAVAATTCLPFYGGPPVRVSESLACVDGGLSSAGRVPLRRAIDSGASHIFVFWTDKKAVSTYPKDPKEKFAAWWLRRHYPEMGDYWLGDEEHRRTIDTISKLDENNGKLPLIEIVRVPEHEIPKSTETNPDKIYAATLAGRSAMLKAFEPYGLPVNTDVTFKKPRHLRNT